MRSVPKPLTLRCSDDVHVKVTTANLLHDDNHHHHHTHVLTDATVITHTHHHEHTHPQSDLHSCLSP